MSRDPESVTIGRRRTLSVHEYGPREGRPVLFSHGMPGSGVDAKFAESFANAHGLRIIAPSRPGIGNSDFDVMRTLDDWPDDMRRLLDTLKIDEATLVGVSGGTPYALICAHRMAQRFPMAVILSGLGPWDKRGLTEKLAPFARQLLTMGRRAPHFLPVVFRILERYTKDGSVMKLSNLPESDRRALTDPDIANILQESTVETLRQGVRGAAHDLGVIAGPWRFPLEDIHIPVHFIHGEEDWYVPPEMSAYMASRIRDAIATYIPDRGHLLATDISGEFGERLREVLAPGKTPAQTLPMARKPPAA